MNVQETGGLGIRIEERVCDAGRHCDHPSLIHDHHLLVQAHCDPAAQYVERIAVATVEVERRPLRSRRETLFGRHDLVAGDLQADAERITGRDHISCAPLPDDGLIHPPGTSHGAVSQTPSLGRYAPGARYWTCPALRTASNVWSISGAFTEPCREATVTGLEPSGGGYRWLDDTLD